MAMTKMFLLFLCVSGKFDPTKLVRYPGFNVDVPEGVDDVSMIFRDDICEFGNKCK